MSRPDPSTAGADPSDAELEAAVEALSRPGRFDEAEALVARAAPQLQRILAQALETGGWFADSHTEQLTKTLAIEDPAERQRALSVLLAEETRMGMMVGVAVGWALAQELRGDDPATPPSDDPDSHQPG